MTPDLDIYRSAQVLVKQHGADAPIQAVMLAGTDCRAAKHAKTDQATVGFGG